ncbi:MAG: ATPase [Actinobacteria bacterium HGW-Actinobacteria-10]|nr:MAG: ATPase [Actinobacteria bacterium HGW-Actinobacteria-10]
MQPESIQHRAAWHALSTEEVLERLRTGTGGLTRPEAEKRLAEYGPNVFEETRPPGPLALFLKQLSSPLIIMLIIAAGISVLAGHGVDAIVIGAVVVFNALVGTTQEWRAEKALEALRGLAAPRARVVRDGETLDIDAADVVPGDLLILETGDRVAADARLIEAMEIAVDESSLTGESEPVRKAIDRTDEEAQLAEQLNMAWKSTAVTGGRGLGLVVETGMSTVIGQIASSVQESKRADTPLQERLTKLGTLIGIVALVAATSVFVLGLLQGYEVVEMLLFAIATAVSAIPEGLPAVITVVLAVGVQRMSSRNAIVRRLPAVETLGSTSVVCSDKTGTITRNQMTVRRVWTAAGTYHVEGDGFEPEGRFLDEANDPVGPGLAGRSDLELLLKIGALTNNAVLKQNGSEWSISGNPTDGALLVAARKMGLTAEELQRTHPRLDEVPFSSVAKYAATLNEWDGESRMLVKGAPERLLDASTHIRIGETTEPLTDELKVKVRGENDELAGDALRVVAAAYRVLPQGTGTSDAGTAESDLVFLGMWGLLDPPREEAITAIASAQKAGMRVVMITGDHATTAAAIASRVGILQAGGEAVDGRELDEMSDDELGSRVAGISVYARVEPRHKLRIVKALQSRGETVAMTGDGVNDAPALKSADIGIAMGMTGTEVAKEAADMVLADDNFATIIDAVEEGRVIFSNLRRAVAFLVTTSLGEVLTLVSALVLGFSLPVTAVMILWINLVTDGITGIPLGLEPKHADVLRRPPRSPDEGVLTRGTMYRIAALAALTATGTLSLFAWETQTKDLAHAQTIAFTTLAAFEWFKSMTWRTSNESVFQVGLLSNRWLILALAAAIPLQVAVIYTPLGQLAFGTVPLDGGEWLRIVAVSSSVLVFDELGKAFRRR